MTHLAYAMAAGAVLGVISGAVLAGAAMRMRFRGILQKCEGLIDEAEKTFGNLGSAQMALEMSHVGEVFVEEHPFAAISYFAAYRDTIGGRICLKRAYYRTDDADARDYAELYINEVADKLNEEV